MKKEAACLEHDLNARNNPKILILRSVYGLEGYGRYWILIEMMREQKDCKIMLKPYVWNTLALQMQCTPQEAQEFVEFCVKEARLFECDEAALWSPSLIRRTRAASNAKDASRRRAKKAAAARWNKNTTVAEEDTENATDDAYEMQDAYINDAQASQEADICDSQAMQNECKIVDDAMHEQCVERKEKEAKRKEININSFVLPPYNPPKAAKQDDSVSGEIVDAEIAEVFKKYSDNIHPVTGEIESDKLHDLLKRYGRAWVVAAIEQAVKYNRRSLGYIEGILRNWGTSGFDDGGGNGNGTNSGSNRGVSRQAKKYAASRKETDWSVEPEGLPPI